MFRQNEISHLFQSVNWKLAMRKADDRKVRDFVTIFVIVEFAREALAPPLKCRPITRHRPSRAGAD